LSFRLRIVPNLTIKIPRSVRNDILVPPSSSLGSRLSTLDSM
jgi:hypothetical protein